MNRKILCRAALSFIGLGLSADIVSAADYSGNYESAQLNVVIAPNGTAYDGEIRMADKKFPLTAHEEGNHLSGTFAASGATFTFTATGQGNELTLITSGTTYLLRRHSNPPAVLPPAHDAAQAPPAAEQGADPLADYVLMKNTEAGSSLVREIPNLTSTHDALAATFPDLARFFHDRPTILGGYEDQKEHKSAFVSFTAKNNGQPIKGFVTTKLRAKGAVVFVVFGNVNATPAEWGLLTSGVAYKPTIDDQMAMVPLAPYSFPDGTGAIGLAEGYTTNAQTEAHLLVTGPAGQRIRMATGGTLYTPNNQTARQLGNDPKFNMAIAPYSPDPATALDYILRANSAVNARKGGPTYSIEKKHPGHPDSEPSSRRHAAQITYDMTGHEPGGTKHYRVFVQFEISPLVNGTWGYYTSLQLMAPQETFEHDYPVMMAQAFSMSENADAIRAKSAREMGAAKARADAQHAAADKVAKARYAYTKGVEENETIKMRAITDFDETIRGERTIEDTRTGAQSSVNLADVHNIVDKLNEPDPGRYREIPLRDQFFPMTGRGSEQDYLPR